MTNWKYNVYLADLFQNFGDKEEDELTEDDIGIVIKGTYQRLLLLQKEINEKDEDPEYLLDGPSGLDNIINDLQYFDHRMFYDDQLDEFDRIMNDLYDFADYHFVWINTFDKSANGIGKP